LRTGHVDQAWDRLQRELPRLPFAPNDVSRTELSMWTTAPYPESQCFLTLLHAKRGQLADAEAALKRAKDPTSFRPPARSPLMDENTQTWHGKLIRTMLLQEAEQAVEELRGKSPK
jgi:hypothetical protein